MAESAATDVPLNDAAVDAVREHLAGRLDEMVEFIARLARMESPTRDPAAQAPVQAAVAERLETMDWRVRRLRGEQTGGHIWARPHDTRAGAPFQLLVGHSDTVWPHGTLESMPVEVDLEEGVLRGPGVFDMKCGVTQILFALEALDALGLEPSVTPAVFMNSDEETGSPESDRHVERLARHAARALVLEPEVLLMDEPCSALDPLAGAVVEDLVAGLRGRVTVLIVTHNLAQARRLADWAALFWKESDAGRLVEHGAVQHLFESPKEELTAAYVRGRCG